MRSLKSIAAKTMVLSFAVLAAFVLSRETQPPDLTAHLTPTPSQDKPAVQSLAQPPEAQESAPQLLEEKLAEAQPLPGILAYGFLPAKESICSQIWDSYPEEDALPTWLQTPTLPAGLRTRIPYAYLAGRLIHHSVVDAGDCQDGGLMENGSANTCGLERAAEAVTEWQNRFDEAIFLAAIQNGVPAVLLKRVLAQESQFWPSISESGIEFGIGQTTETGIDALFLWYPDLYKQVCASVFTEDTCTPKYSQLRPYQKSMLRGYLLSQKFDATCPSCPLGIDVYKAEQSIDGFAKLIVANCRQVGQLVYNLTGKPAGMKSNYTDLWTYTLVNYNSGAGCLSEALQATLSEWYNPLNWTHVAGNLKGECSRGVVYAQEIIE